MRKLYRAFLAPPGAFPRIPARILIEKEVSFKDTADTPDPEGSGPVFPEARQALPRALPPLVVNREVKSMSSPQSESRFSKVLSETRGLRADLIPLLQQAQEAFGYVPLSAMEAISSVTSISLAEIYGVVTFYKQFRLTPRGDYVVKVCNGTACHVNGSSQLEATLEEVLQVKRGETDAEGLFTLESVNCIGCCSLAPVVMVNEETYGSLTPRKLTALLKRIRKEAVESRQKASETRAS